MTLEELQKPYIPALANQADLTHSIRASQVLQGDVSLKGH